MSKFVPTMRIKCGLPPIEQIPLNRLSILQHALLELDKRMLDLRIDANVNRLTPHRAGCFEYLHGMFNGVRFGFVSALLFCGDTDEDYYVFSERVQAYENEIQFLWSIYQRDQS